MRPRLNAFTLLELVVVMAVSSILFAMAYAALRLVQRQQVVVERRTASLGQISTWQDVLGADFRAADFVEARGDELRCQRRAGPLITYEWLDSALVRQQGEVSDTLALPVRERAYFWQGQPRTTGPIDELTLTVVTARDTFYLQAAAHYAAQQLLAAPTISPSPTP
ncbi:MAG TPA: prepilin-type N-terminal cleavage/methylation domain-containing protein [Hymenobacter sp.]|jgi:prepilin-type N-terminal cleavage/methylation domain-containing protein